MASEQKLNYDFRGKTEKLQEEVTIMHGPGWAIWKGS